MFCPEAFIFKFFAKHFLENVENKLFLDEKLDF